VNERRILKVWHANRKGLVQSLNLMDRDLGTLPAATPGEQAARTPTRSLTSRR
jgi:hypothetical protein